MNTSPLPLLLYLLTALHAQGQAINSINLTPVPDALSGTNIVNLKGFIPSSNEYVLEDSADLATWNRVSPMLKPENGALDWSLQSGPSWASGGIQVPNISNTWYTSRFYRLRALPPADAPPQTIPTIPRGRLWQPLAGGPLYLTTRANWRISIDGSTITITSPDLKAKWETWGDGVGDLSHENLNGKHIKDWEIPRRTILLPGDTMITFIRGEQIPGSGVLTMQTISIYDADQSHRLNRFNNTVEMSVYLSRVGEAEEPDGETMRIWHIGGGRYYAENIYVEETVGETPALQQAVPLGDTGGDANPTQTNDYYDDPRLSRT